MLKRFYYFIKSAGDILGYIGIGWMMLCGVLGYLGHTNNMIFNSWIYGASCVVAGLIFETVRIFMSNEFESKSEELL